jgi:hypothetical protein
MLRIFMSVLVLGVPAPALAQHQAVPPKTDPEETRDPMVCKRLQQTGTRIGSQRVCQTQSQWDLERRQREEMQRQGSQLRPNANQ